MNTKAQRALIAGLLAATAIAAAAILTWATHSPATTLPGALHNTGASVPWCYWPKAGYLGPCSGYIVQRDV